MEHIERAHPFGVTFGQIVVYGYHMYTVSGQCVEEYGEGSHQCLTFTRCHFGDLTFMQYDATEQLYIVVYHVPDNFRTACLPVVLPDGFVAFNAYEVFRGSQVTVEFGSRHYDFFIFG